MPEVDQHDPERLLIDVGTFARAILTVAAFLAVAGLGISCVYSPYLGVIIVLGNAGGGRAWAFLAMILVFALALIVRDRSGVGNLADEPVRAVRRVTYLLWFVAAIPPFVDTAEVLRVGPPWGESGAVLGSWALLLLGAGALTSARSSWKRVAWTAAVSASLIMAGVGALAFAYQELAVLAGTLAAVLVAVLAYGAMRLASATPPEIQISRASLPPDVGEVEGKPSDDRRRDG